MPDLEEVLIAIAQVCDTALYPNGDPGFNLPSPITGYNTRVYPGWPTTEQLDNDLKNQVVHVTVFSPGGADGAGTKQVWEDASVVVAPIHNVAPTVVVTPPNAAVTLGGNPPAVGEYVTFVLDNKHSYSHAAVSGDTLATMASNLAGQIAVNYPGTAAIGNVVNLVGTTYITVRVGAPATMGHIEHRQNHLFRVSIWAPTPAARLATAKAVDTALKTNWRLNFADTSQGLLVHVNNMVDDFPEKANLFRRDTNFTCEYATLNEFTAYEITSVNITLDPGVNKQTQVVQ